MTDLVNIGPLEGFEDGSMRQVVVKGEPVGIEDCQHVSQDLSALLDVSESEYSVSLWFKTDAGDGGLFSIRLKIPGRLPQGPVSLRGGEAPQDY